MDPLSLMGRGALTQSRRTECPALFAGTSAAPAPLGLAACLAPRHGPPPSLCQCPVLSLRDAVKGLFVCCTFLDYVALSQRFVPELLNFLLGILYMATPNKPGQGESTRGSFPRYAALENCSKGF